MRAFDPRTNYPAKSPGFIENWATAHATIKLCTHLIAWEWQLHVVAPPLIDLSHDSHRHHGFVIEIQVTTTILVFREDYSTLAISKRADSIANLGRKWLDM